MSSGIGNIDHYARFYCNQELPCGKTAYRGPLRSRSNMRNMQIPTIDNELFLSSVFFFLNILGHTTPELGFLRMRSYISSSLSTHAKDSNLPGSTQQFSAENMLMIFVNASLSPRWLVSNVSLLFIRHHAIGEVTKLLLLFCSFQVPPRLKITVSRGCSNENNNNKNGTKQIS